MKPSWFILSLWQMQNEYNRILFIISRSFNDISREGTATSWNIRRKPNLWFTAHHLHWSRSSMRSKFVTCMIWSEIWCTISDGLAVFLTKKLTYFTNCCQAERRHRKHAHSSKNQWNTQLTPVGVFRQLKDAKKQYDDLLGLFSSVAIGKTYF